MGQANIVEQTASIPTDKVRTLKLQPLVTASDYLFTFPPSSLNIDIATLLEIFKNNGAPPWAKQIANETDLDKIENFISSLDDTLADVVLDFGSDKQIYVHKDILLVRSEYFRNMFNSGMAESEQTVINMEEETYESMKIIKNYFYTEKMLNEEKELKCLDLIHVVDMYAAEHVRLMEFCVQQVYSQLDQTNLESTYNYAKELQLTLLLRACEYFIITNQIPNYQVSELETQKITCASYDYHDRDYPHNPNPRHLTQQKVVIIGHHQCGKTTLWNLLLNRPFENKYQETTSFDFNYHVQTLPSGDFCNLQIWDSIGKEKFSNNVNMNHDMYYFHKTNILLLCFAFDDRTSFEYVRDYLFPKIDEDYNSKFHVMLLGLKLDCEHQVMRKEALGLAESKKVPYHEFSIYSNEKMDVFMRCFGNLIYEACLK